MVVGEVGSGRGNYEPAEDFGKVVAGCWDGLGGC